MRFDHIGIAAATIENGGYRELTTIFDIVEHTEEFRYEINKVFVKFLRDRSGIVYEIVSPLGKGSPLDRAIETGQRTLNHVAYLVEDIDSAARRMLKAGAAPTGPARPAIAYSMAPIRFFVTPNHTVIEFIAAFSHTHRFSPVEAEAAKL